jgi:hypothetical protein
MQKEPYHLPAGHPTCSPILDISTAALQKFSRQQGFSSERRCRIARYTPDSWKGRSSRRGLAAVVDQTLAHRTTAHHGDFRTPIRPLIGNLYPRSPPNALSRIPFSFHPRTHHTHPLMLPCTHILTAYQINDPDADLHPCSARL